MEESFLYECRMDGVIVTDMDRFAGRRLALGGRGFSDHVVRLQVLLVLSICDLYRVLYFWKKKPGSSVRGGVGF